MSSSSHGVCRSSGEDFDSSSGDSHFIEYESGITDYSESSSVDELESSSADESESSSADESESSSADEYESSSADEYDSSDASTDEDESIVAAEMASKMMLKEVAVSCYVLRSCLLINMALLTLRICIKYTV